MINALRICRVARLLVLAAFLIPFAVPAAAQSSAAAAQSSAADAAKVVGLMQADSYTFHATNSPTVWTIHFAGTHIKDIKVVVAVGDGPDTTLVVFVTVAEKRRMPVTTDFMRNLLEQNHKLNRVKIGFDKDGDLEVDIDAKLRVTDAAEFKDIFTQVRDASDQIYGMIEPQLSE